MEKNKRVLILGSHGMLGQELLRAYSEERGYEISGWDRGDVDVTDFVQTEEKIRKFAPHLLINAVAYNAVDRCEESPEENARALLLNRDVPKFLARLAKELKATFVHYSSDYVFDGALEENKAKTGCCGGGCCKAGSSEPGYDEESIPNPVSRYGESKLLGENEVRAAGGDYYLIRLSKLFGKPALGSEGKRSFFEMMLEKARAGAELQVVDDEKSCFTYAPDLAEATKALTENAAAPSGIYHLVNTGAATWYEAAVELFRTTGTVVQVRPVEAQMFPRAAKRPKCSVLLNTKCPPLRPYTEALKEYILNPRNNAPL